MKYKNLFHLLEKQSLVLASGSPRRVDILKKNGVNFRQILPQVKENDDSTLSPYELAMRLAEKKARSVLSQVSSRELILGCDTIVILNGKVLGKPLSERHAFDMLMSLSGNRHTVCSAAVLLNITGHLERGYELTDVYFKPLLPGRAREYIQTKEPLDKAGAYGIQEYGAFLVDRIDGNIDNVIGLPMTLLEELAFKFMAG